MNNLKIVKPLISMFASIIMCVILSACQNSRASTKQVDHMSSSFVFSDQQLRIRYDSGKRNYLVDGKHFKFEQLTDDQKKRITELESNLNKFVEIDEGRLEAWSEKMETIAEQMETETERFEDTVDDLDFEEDSQSLEGFSFKIAKASRNLESKIQQLEQKLNTMLVEMPEIDQKAISQLQAEAKNMGRVLSEIAEGI